MVYWSTENDLSQIPILRFVNSWWAKLPLALMGLACGFAMHYLIEGGSIRDLVDEAAKQALQRNDQDLGYPRAPVPPLNYYFLK